MPTFPQHRLKNSEFRKQLKQQQQNEIKFSSQLDVSLTSNKIQNNQKNSKILVNVSKSASKSTSNVNNIQNNNNNNDSPSQKHSRTRSLSNGSNSSINLSDSLLNKKSRYDNNN
jgi:hypothetical protein